MLFQGLSQSTLSQGVPQADQTRCGHIESRRKKFLKELQIEVSENSTELLKNEKNT